MTWFSIFSLCSSIFHQLKQGWEGATAVQDSGARHRTTVPQFFLSSDLLETTRFLSLLARKRVSEYNLGGKALSVWTSRISGKKLQASDGTWKEKILHPRGSKQEISLDLGGKSKVSSRKFSLGLSQAFQDEIFRNSDLTGCLSVQIDNQSSALP